MLKEPLTLSGVGLVFLSLFLPYVMVGNITINVISNSSIGWVFILVSPAFFTVFGTNFRESIPNAEKQVDIMCFVICLLGLLYSLYVYQQLFLHEGGGQLFKAQIGSYIHMIGFVLVVAGLSKRLKLF